MFKASNPVLNEKTFTLPSAIDASGSETMSAQGTASKTALLLLLALLPASYVWSQFFAGNQNVMPFVLAGGLGGFVMVIIITIKKTAAPVLSPVYAFLEGLFLGGISAVLEMQFPGIVIQAVGLTFGVAAAMLMAYKSGLISAQGTFMRVIMAALGGIFLLYMATWILGIFGIGIPFIHNSGPFGIGFSLVVCAIAGFSLIMDFDLIEQGARQGAPKYMEWYGAFALMVGLVWLYIEILRLLLKISRRR